MKVAAGIVAEGLCVERNHNGRFVLVTEDVNHAGLKYEMTSLDGGEFQPSCNQNTQDMTMGEKDDIIPDRLGSGNDPVAALGNLFGGVAVRCRMGKDGPVRIFLADLLGGDPLVVSVMPLGQVLGDFCLIKLTCKLAGSSGSLVRAAEDQLEVPFRKLLLERSGLALSFQGQGNFTEGGMSTVFAPFGFTVTDKNDLGT